MTLPLFFRRGSLSLCFLLAFVAAEGRDTAADFVRLLKEENYEKAYELLAPELRREIDYERFQEEQGAEARRYRREFGTSGIKKAEELYLIEEAVPLSVRDQLTLRDVNLGKFLFWRQWFSKRKRRIFQFVFDQGRRVVFGVDTLSTPSGTFVLKYEYLPSLQKVLASGRPGLAVKKTRLVA